MRVAGETYLTLTTLAGGNATAARERLERRLSSLRAEPLPMLDPSPTETRTISSVLPPRHFEDAVAAAVARIRAGDLDKVVLAREVAVEASAAHDPAAVFGALRELFPSCFSFCVGTPEAAFLGASPELLVRRRGASVATVALAGSTRRSADPAVDDHLAEQLLQSEKNQIEHRIVARRIARKLSSRSVWVQAGKEPEVIKVANIQHLATPVHAQLAEPSSAVDLAGAASPDPGGRRRARREGPGADRRARGDGPWLVRGARRMDGRGRGRRVLRCAALGSTARPDRPSLRRRRHRRPTPIRRPSSPRPSSSSRRCCRCWPASYPSFPRLAALRRRARGSAGPRRARPEPSGRARSWVSRNIISFRHGSISVRRALPVGNRRRISPRLESPPWQPQRIPRGRRQALRQWRERRRLTQMELALDTGVSARHLSFVETGRSKPGRDMLLSVLGRLELPFREQNRLLLAAGHAPAFPERSLDGPELAPVRDALDVILGEHEPYPALAVDRSWNLVAANRPMLAVAELVDIDPSLLEPPVNVIRLGLHPRGMAPLMVNLGDWHAHWLERLSRQYELTGDEALGALIEEMAGYPVPERERDVFRRDRRQRAPRPRAYARAWWRRVVVLRHVRRLRHTVRGDDVGARARVAVSR